jgi:hypothetical protein
MNKFAVVLVLCTSALAHTIADPSPFHLSPGDFFTIPVAGAAFSGTAGIQVRFTPVGGGAPTSQAPENVVANTSVGVRVPAGLAAGQYDLNVSISGVNSDSPDKRVWVRVRTFRFVGKSITYLPNMPPDSTGADYKDVNFGDLNNDGFLDLFSANSLTGNDIDRLHINQRGKIPAARDCPQEFCDATATKFENSVTGIPSANRTYDADWVDVDLDGDLDLVRVDRLADAPLRLFINDGTGRLVDRSVTRAGIGPALLPSFANVFGAMGGGQIATADQGDADGDGRPDLLLCNWSPNSARTVLLLNRIATTGAFVIANTACSGSSGDAFCQTDGMTNRGCGFGNFNNDNRRDIILADLEESGEDKVLINTGNNGSGVPQFNVEANWIRGAAPGFGPQTAAKAGNVMVADLDGDGDDDVAISSPWNPVPQGRILWNDAGTRLVELASTRYVIPNGSYKVTFSDLDRDGDLDIFFNPYSGGISEAVLINKGGRNADMKFEAIAPGNIWYAESPGGAIVSAPPSFLDFSLTMSPGDFDLDGDIDVSTGGFSKVRVWRNDLFDQPGEDRDWIFALDRTRSMVSGGVDFFEPAKNVLKTFLGQRRPGDLAGLVAFDYTGPDPGNPNAADNVNKAQIIAPVGSRTFAQLQSDVTGLALGSCSGNCTAIGWAIKTANDVAAGAPDTRREKVIVLATDGGQNQGPHPDTIIPTLPSNVRLYTIALGSNTDDRMLSALATNGGKFYFAGRSSDYASVQSALRDIDEDVESDSTGKQVLYPFAGLVWSSAFKDVLAKSSLLRAARLPITPLAVAAVAQPVDHFFVDPSDRQARFSLSWRGANRENRMTLIDPKGRTYPITGDPRVRETRTPQFHIIEVADPLSGLWTVRHNVTSASAPAKLTGIASSDLRLGAAFDFPLYYVGEALTLRASLTEAVPGTRVELKLRTPGLVDQTFAGRVNGTNLEITIPSLGEPGTYRVEIIAVGPPNRPFVRTWHSALHVATPTPNEPDLRKADLRIDRNRLTAGSSDAATATLRLVRRDGTPVAGAKVSFVVDGGRLTDTVEDLGAGQYRQRFTAGDLAGKGVVRARIDLTRLPNRAEFTVEPAGVDKGKSTFDLVVGIQKLCTNQRGQFLLRVIPVDGFENELSGADVRIDKVSGPYLQWAGPVRKDTTTGIYERPFWGPAKAGVFEFRARVNGVELTKRISMDVFAWDSAEGRSLGCVAIAGNPPFDWRHYWWIWLLLLLLLLLFFVWWRKHHPMPGVA